jgi:hypothetical protein
MVYRRERCSSRCCRHSSNLSLRRKWVLLMTTTTIAVEIVGSPIACAEGVKETWRELADWAAAQLRTRYGDQVQVTYYDLFDPACPPLPAGGQLPLVTVHGETVISGGKLAMPVIRRRLEALGVEPLAVH